MHKINKEIKTLLNSDLEFQSKWNMLTPLSKNEWICWITSPKKEETRQKHLKRFKEEVKSDKKRPCCWAGCLHRKDLRK